MEKILGVGFVGIHLWYCFTKTVIKKGFKNISDMKIQQNLLYILLAFFAATFSTQAQIEDEATIEIDYSITPKGNSIGMQAFTFSMPIYGKELEKSMLYAAVDYGLTSFKYAESIHLPADLNRFHSFTLQLGAFKTLQKSWVLGAMFTPTLNTNFRHNIVSDDILWTGGIFASKDFGKKHPSTLTFGVGDFPYGGRPETLPFVSYEIEIKKFVLSFGFPDTEITYYINDRSSLNIALLFAGNSFYFGQEDGNLLTVQSDRIDFSSIIAGLGYDHLISESFGVYMHAGYEFNRTHQLLSPESEIVISFNLANTLNINTGFYYIL